jgi:hypothetical protein
MRQVLQVAPARVSERLAQAVVAVLCEHNKRAQLLRVLPHKACVLHVPARRVTPPPRKLAGAVQCSARGMREVRDAVQCSARGMREVRDAVQCSAVCAQRNIGLVSEVEEHAAAAVVAPVVERYKKPLHVRRSCRRRRCPAEVVDFLKRRGRQIVRGGCSPSLGLGTIKQRTCSKNISVALP